MKALSIIIINCFLMVGTTQSQTLTAGFGVSGILSSHRTQVTSELGPRKLLGGRLSAFLIYNPTKNLMVKGGVSILERQWGIPVLKYDDNRNIIYIDADLLHNEITIPLSVHYRFRTKKALSPYVLVGTEFWWVKNGRAEFLSNGQYVDAYIRGRNKRRSFDINYNNRYWIGAGLDLGSLIWKVAPYIEFRYFLGRSQYLFGGTEADIADEIIDMKFIEVSLGFNILK